MSRTNGTPRTATYSIAAPGGTWNQADNGAYVIAVADGQILDTSGNPVAGVNIGGFTVNIDQTAPTALASAADIIVAGNGAQTITVDFSDNAEMNVASIDAGDVTVIAPDSTVLALSLVSIDDNTNGTPRSATFSLAAPGGAWDYSSNGAYAVHIAADAVSDTSGNGISAGNIGAFQVTIPDTTLPAASAAAADITSPSATAQQITVTLSDNVAIDVTTLADANLVVIGPDNQSYAATFVGVDTNTDGSPRTATFSVTAPGGTWDQADNGAYAIMIAPTSIADTNGNFVPAGPIGGFTVDIDQTAPTASASGEEITVAGGATQDISVILSDNKAIDVSTISAGDFGVIAPDDTNLPVELVSVSSGTNGSPRTVTLRVNAPGGTWQWDSSGTYLVAIADSAIADTSGNAVVGGNIGSFQVSVPRPPDVTGPDATATASSITTGGGMTQDITVVITDDRNIDVATLGDDDIQVLDPQNSPIAATFIGVNNNTNGSPRTATYRISAPNGSWHQADNGAYAVRMAPTAVADEAGNAVATGTIGAFQVDIDETAPTAVASVSDITVGGGTTQEITVVYSDAYGIDVSTLGDADLQVITPDGSFPATFIGVNDNANGSPRTASYRIQLPGGAWHEQDNGRYIVAAAGGQIRDTRGNALAGHALRSFWVNIDETAPSAVATAPDITAGGGTTQTISVTYSDNAAINPATLGDGDLVVLDAQANPLAVTFVGLSGGTATYALGAPGGAWGQEDNGTFTIQAVAGQVTDTSGNPIGGDPGADPTAIGSFSVNIDQTRPTASAGANDLFVSPPTQYVMVTFSDNVAVDPASITDASIVLVGPDNQSVPAVLSIVDNAAPGTPRQGIYIVDSPHGQWDHTDNGAWTIDLAPGGVIDTSGNPSLGGHIGTFSVNIPTPDTTAPTASAAAPDITTAGDSGATITVTLSDTGGSAGLAGIDVSTLDDADLGIIGPNGDLSATFISVDVDSNGTPRTASYSLDAPDGAWSYLDNGTYVIAVADGEIADASGNPVAGGNIGSFTIDIPVPDMIDPTAEAHATNLTSAGGDAKTFTVTFSDDTAIDLSTITASAIEVTDPQDAAVEATLDSIDADADGTPITATFSIAAPGGTWDPSDNGGYMIAIAPNQVADTSGNFVAPSRIGAFTVAISTGTPMLAAGPSSGASADVRVFNANGELRTHFTAFEDTYLGGVRLASADIDGDGVVDVLAATGGGRTGEVLIFNGVTGAPISGPLSHFFPYSATYAGGIFIAAGDINGDGRIDVVTATDAGVGVGPHVKAFSGIDGSLLRSFWAYNTNFDGGVRVASGDVNGDGYDDIITGAGSSGPHVKIFSGADGSQLASFWGLDPSNHVGVNVASGEFNGDGLADIVVSAGSGATPQVRVFSGANRSLLASFLAYSSSFTGGVRVAVSDLNADGHDDILTTSGAGMTTLARVFSGQTFEQLDSFLPYASTYTGGAYVAGA